jgi:oxalate decarboxylase/phosphoglucose isomerase-like protein (cupin superfamily)
MKASIVRKNEVNVMLEGEEFTRVYAHTDRLIFSIGSLLPGQRACLDKGHEGSDEICYVIKGTIVMHLPSAEQYCLLSAGDAILIPPGESHYSVNVGDEPAITAWACAPKL